MKNTFVRFTNLVQKLYAEQPAASAEVDSLLAHIYEQNDARVPVCITDLVRAERFGTLPTLSKRLQDMEKRGLIKVATGADRRTRLVEVASGGVEVLENRAKLLSEAAAAADRQRKPAKAA
ncbi:MAG: hypothetical protein K9J04_04005 [Burkholderiales bacterium]|jgi:DNA-binding MarR family transcriptional regulator|nr:hypothetical protein [Burkholderiales bacterium]